MADPSAATPAGGSVIHDLGYRPYTGPRLGPGAIARALVAHRLPQRLRSRPVRQVEGAALRPARAQPAARRHRRRGAWPSPALDELPIGYAEYAVDHPGAPRHLRRVAGPGALLARPAPRHHLALPRAPAAVRAPTPLARWASLLARDPGLPARCRSSSSTPSRCSAELRRRRADPRGRRRGRARRAARPARSPASPGSSRRGRPAAASPSSPPSPCCVIANGIVTAVQGISSEEGRSRGRGGRRAVLAVLALPRPDGRLDRRRRADTSDRRAGMELAYVGVLRRAVRWPASPRCVWRYRRVATA